MLRLVGEFTAMARNAMLAQKVDFVHALLAAAPVGVLPALEVVLNDAAATRREVLVALDILSCVLSVDAATMRAYCVGHKHHPPALVVGGSQPGGTAEGDRIFTAADAASGEGLRLSERVAGIYGGGGAGVDPDYCRRHLADGEHGVLVSGGGGGGGGGSGEPRACLLFALVWRLLDDPDVGVQLYCADMLKLLLDTEDVPQVAREAFLRLWYDSYSNRLFLPFSVAVVRHNPPAAAMAAVRAALGEAGATRDRDVAAATGVACRLRRAAIRRLLPLFGTGWPGGEGQPYGGETAASKNSKLLVLEVLAMCMRLHTFQMKYCLLRTGGIIRLMRLARYRERHLQVAVLRFLKSVVTAEDDFYNRYLVRHHLLAAVAAVLLENEGRDTLVTSTGLDLLAAMAAAIKSRVVWDALLTDYAPVLQALSYHPVIQGWLEAARIPLVPPTAPVVAPPAPPVPPARPRAADGPPSPFRAPAHAVAAPAAVPARTAPVDEFEFVDDLPPGTGGALASAPAPAPAASAPAPTTPAASTEATDNGGGGPRTFLERSAFATSDDGSDEDGDDLGLGRAAGARRGSAGGWGGGSGGGGGGGQGGAGGGPKAAAATASSPTAWRVLPISRRLPAGGAGSAAPLAAGSGAAGARRISISIHTTALSPSPTPATPSTAADATPSSPVAAPSE